MDVLHALVHYPAVRGLVYLVMACLAVTVGFLVVVGGLHMLHSLGKRTVLYAKRQPASGWGKRFYPATMVLIICIVLLMVWLRSLLL